VLLLCAVQRIYHDTHHNSRVAFRVAAFYKFVPVPDLVELKERLKELSAEAGTVGTILLAPEGINGTIAGRAEAVERVLTALRSEPRFADLETKESETEVWPFQRMKVRLKKEIIRMNVPEADPTVKVGTYVDPTDWNDLIQDPDVVLVDTRNAYEVEVGTFRGARDPGTRVFSQFPTYVQRDLDPAVHKRVATFCTGGIRCEKATAYLLAQGFEEVYHLRGGIIRYLKEVPAEESLWEGKCFVFDERAGVDGETA